MGDNINTGDDLFTNLDSNQGPFVNPLPPSPPAIEDRIRLIQAVCARARQLTRRRVRDSCQEKVDGDRLRNHKRDISHLTKALEMDLFDCNMCMSMARNPVLTCCGHLFCWGCFYHVPYVDSVTKECPVCKGEVIDSNVTPVYGNGNGNGNNSQESELDSMIRIPPRPQARRVESVGQQSVGWWTAHNPVANASVLHLGTLSARGLLLVMKAMQFGIASSHESYEIWLCMIWIVVQKGSDWRVV
ncbi:hypothetical protein L1987_83583 [Smallanthus sonchifolius]|uniref:Uncharacterized protein n=1 Tax=Smallanthus sonchifolius TaxID=185202 RepID=A0ACB8YD89_9ASTR|nr:hypothetical protein L1987_83583 [Smallanthus sonchifolius]